MLEVLVRNANGNLSHDDRDYAIKKLSKLDRYFNGATKAELAHRADKRGHIIEVTVFADGIPLHGREVEVHAHAAIDSVVDKLEAQLRKLNKRNLDRRQGRRDRANFKAA